MPHGTLQPGVCPTRHPVARGEVAQTSDSLRADALAGGAFLSFSQSSRFCVNRDADEHRRPVRCMRMTPRWELFRPWQGLESLGLTNRMYAQLLEQEKKRNLSKSQHKTSTPHKYAPGWNEYLASASEANVKVHRSAHPHSGLTLIHYSGRQVT